MKNPRKMRWIAAGLGACLLAGGYFVARPWHRAPSLLTENEQKQFPHLEAVLQKAQEKVRAHPTDPEALRALAHLFHANRMYPKARDHYLALAKSGAPFTATDHYYLADIAQNEGDLPLAQKELRLVAETEPRYLPARVALAETLFKTGNEEDAAKEYTAIRALEAGHPQASLGLARIALQRGDDATAISLLDRLLIAHPESTSGAALLAQVLNRRGETERAANMREWSRQMTEPLLLDPWMDALLADCYDRQRLALKFEEYSHSGQFDEAIPLLDRVEELDPQSPIPHVLRGWPLARSKHYDQAIAEYRKALEKGAYPEKVCPLIVSTLLADGKPKEAVQFIAEYHAKFPDSIPILSSYAEAAVQSGDDKTARTVLNQVLEKQPYLYMPNMSLAKILWGAGEREAAVQCLQRVVKIYAVDVPSRGLLGQYYLETSNPAEAIPLLEQAIGQQTTNTPEKDRLTAMLDAAYLKAGIAQVEQQRFPEAMAYYDKAIALRPADLRGYACKASVHVHLKQFRAATQCLEKMAALEPQNPTIYISLGDAQYQDGKRTDAKKTWQKALQLSETTDADLRRDLNTRISGKITADTFK